MATAAYRLPTTAHRRMYLASADVTRRKERLAAVRVIGRSTPTVTPHPMPSAGQYAARPHSSSPSHSDTAMNPHRATTAAACLAFVFGLALERLISGSFRWSRASGRCVARGREPAAPVRSTRWAGAWRATCERPTAPGEPERLRCVASSGSGLQQARFPVSAPAGWWFRGHRIGTVRTRSCRPWGCTSRATRSSATGAGEPREVQGGVLCDEAGQARPAPRSLPDVIVTITVTTGRGEVRRWSPI